MRHVGVDRVMLDAVDAGFGDDLAWLELLRHRVLLSLILLFRTGAGSAPFRTGEAGRPRRGRRWQSCQAHRSSLMPMAPWCRSERHRAHLRECYPTLYQAEPEKRPARRNSFAAGFVTGAAAILGAACIALLSLR